MPINFVDLVYNYNVLFEGITNPVFYYDLNPTSMLEKPQNWERYRFAHGLKVKTDLENDDSNELKWWNANKKQYKQVLLRLLNTISKNNKINIGVIVIPSSRANYNNAVTLLTRNVLRNCKFENTEFIDLTELLVRSKNKKNAHIDGSRNQRDNINTLKIVDFTWLDKVEGILVIDDIVTSGNSFSAVNKVLNQSGYNKEIINFAFARSMNESAISNFDEWDQGKFTNWNNGSNKKTGKIDGIIFDFDQTLVNTVDRNDEFESNIRNARVSSEKSSDTDMSNFMCYISHYKNVYTTYEPEVIKEFQTRWIPFAILSNSWEKRLLFISQIDEVQKIIYPYTYQTHYSQSSKSVKEKHEKYCAYGNRNSYYKNNGLSWKYSYYIQNNIFCAPEVKNDTSDRYTKFSKPSEVGVNQAKLYLIQEFDLEESPRIIGLGNTPEDIIAYNKAEIESVLCLWGVPKELRNFAEKNWGADYTFNSFFEFSKWSRLQDSKNSEEEVYVNYLLNLICNDKTEKKEYIVYEERNGRFWTIKKSIKSREKLIKSKNNISIIVEKVGVGEANLQIVKELAKHEDPDNYMESNINVYMIAKLFDNIVGWESLDFLSRKYDIPITVTKKLDEAYVNSNLNSSQLDCSPNNFRRYYAIKTLKFWKEEKLGWPGV